MAVLKVLKGLTPGQQFALEGVKLILGRHPECDIVLDAGAVSRQHAQISVDGKQFFLEDLQSRNGTFINGQQIREKRRLEENDKIKICDLLFTFHTDDPNRTPAGGAAIAPAAELVDDEAVSSGSTVVLKMATVGTRESLRMTVNAETKLKALLEINQNLGSALSVDKVLPKILDSLFKTFVQADRGFIVLVDDSSGQLIPKAVKHRRPDSDETIRISRTIMNQVMGKKEAILSADAATDQRFDSAQSIADFRIRSMICAPLVDSTGHVLGAIQIDTLDQRSRFQEDDLEMLASVAGQAAIAIENAQLHESELKQNELERDLELAHQVQKGFLPGAPPTIENYEFFDFYQAANHVGGDYFDYIPLSGGRLAFILADVSGHGIAAALLTAKLSSDTRYWLASEPSPSAAVGRMNAAFCASGWDDRFVTMIVAVLDTQTHVLEIVNAGHMAPLLRHPDRRLEPIGADLSGVPLGVDGDFQYEQFSIKLEPGQSLTLYTDGISEAMNAKSELYGAERLEGRLRSAASGVNQLGQIVLTDMRSFVGQRDQNDDICLLIFGRVNA